MGGAQNKARDGSVSGSEKHRDEGERDGLCV